MISLTISLSADPNMTDLLQTPTGTPRIFSQNRTGVGNFRHLSRRISEHHEVL